jgi:transposase
MGRSRGRLTTKIVAVVDAEGRLIALKLTADHARDGRSAEGMLKSISSGNIQLADRV